MKYELLKIIKNKWIIIIATLFLLINSMCFIRYCLSKDSDDVSYTDFKDKIENREDVQAEYEKLNRKYYLSDSYSTVNMKQVEEDLHNLKVDSKLLDYYRQADNYKEWLDNMNQDTLMKVSIKMFGDSDSYSNQVMVKANDNYQKLKKVNVFFSYHGGIEKVLSWKLAVIPVLVLGFLISGSIFFQEKKDGLHILLKTMKIKKSRLYRNKIFTTFILICLFYIIEMIVEYCIAEVLIGNGNIFYPIQNVYGYYTCPLPISIIEYMFLSILIVMLSVFILISVITVLSFHLDNYAYYFVFCTAIVIVMVFATNSPSLLIRSFSGNIFLNPSFYLNQCYYLSFFGIPCRQLYTVIMIQIVCLNGLIVYSGKKYLKDKPKILNKKKKRKKSLRYPVKNTWYEIYKICFVQHAIVLFVLASIYQVGRVCYWNEPSSYYGSIYRLYSEKLEGEKSEEKRTYLINEEERLSELQQEINDINTDSTMSDTEKQELTQKSMMYLQREPIFEYVRNKYESLDEGACYVYEIGYQYLMGEQGKMFYYFTRIICLFFLTIIVSISETFETTHGVNYIICTCGKEKKVQKTKCLIYLVVTGLFTLLMWIPYMIKVNSVFGLHSWNASANNLTMFEGYPNRVTIREAVVLEMIIDYLILIIPNGVIVLLKNRTHSSLILNILGFLSGIMLLLVR